MSLGPKACFCDLRSIQESLTVSLRTDSSLLLVWRGPMFVFTLLDICVVLRGRYHVSGTRCCWLCTHACMFLAARAVSRAKVEHSNVESSPTCTCLFTFALRVHTCPQSYVYVRLFLCITGDSYSGHIMSREMVSIFHPSLP